MLDIINIRNNKKDIIQLLKNKNFDAADLLDVIIDKDDARKANQRSADELLAKRRRQIDARNQKWKQYFPLKCWARPKKSFF